MQPSRPSRPSRNSSIAPLDGTILPSSIFVPAKKSPKDTPEPVVLPPQKHYTATYLDADQLDRDNALLDASIKRQKTERRRSVQIAGTLLIFIGSASAVSSIRFSNPLLMVAGGVIAAAGWGALVRRAWSSELLKYFLLCCIFFFVGTVMIKVWSGVSVVNLWLLFAVISVTGSAFAFLIDPRIQELLD